MAGNTRTSQEYKGYDKNNIGQGSSLWAKSKYNKDDSTVTL